MTAAHTPEYRLELFLTNYKHKGDRVHSELYDVAKVLLTERDQLRQQVAELAQALRETVALLRPESRGGLSDSRARAILAKHAKVSA